MVGRTQLRQSIFKTAGFWLAVLIGVFQAVNVIRVMSDPVGFAAYMGLPISGQSEAGFVYIYALRTAFIAALVFILLALKKIEALSWMALAALIMPIGDAVLAAQADAPISTILRHALIAVYILITFIFLRRAASALAGDRT